MFYAGAKAVPLAVKKRLARIATTTAQLLDSACPFSCPRIVNKPEGLMTYRNASRSSPRLAASLPQASATQVSVLRKTAQGSRAERITSVLPESEFWWCLRRTEGRKTAAREKTGITHVAPSGWSATSMRNIYGLLRWSPPEMKIVIEDSEEGG